MIDNFGYPSKKTQEGEITSKNFETLGGVPCVENIGFGKVVGYVGNEILALQKPAPNMATMSANFVSSNVINCNVTVIEISSNEKQVDPVTTAISPVTFTTSNDATYDLLASAIETAGGTGVNCTVDDTAKTIIVTHDENKVVYLSDIVVTAGASQATPTYSFSGTLLGPVPKAEIEQDADGVAQYTPTMIVAPLQKGSMYMKSIDAINYASTCCVQFIDNGTTKRGDLRTGTDSGKAMAFSSLVPDGKEDAGALVNIKLNRP
jgi:hypothetical protein